MRRAAVLLSAAAMLRAHVVSMSTGELRVDGPTATFELRMPVYEVAHTAHPETDLLDHVRFGDGHRTRSSCHEDTGAYICTADYEFPTLHPDAMEVDCTLYQVTVPNHVHLLTATQGPNTDQQVFDQRFTENEVRFHPPSRAEVVARESGAGARRAVATATGVLFLLALALSARTRPEAVTLALVFVASEWLARPIAPHIPVAFSAGFFEAALALTVAYLAVEILFLPEGRLRWLVVGILGLFHGISFASFPPPYLAGASLAQGVAIACLAAASLRMPKPLLRPAASLLLAMGLGWFAFRLFRPL